MRGRQTGRSGANGAKRERESDVPDRRAAWAARAADDRAERESAKQRVARIACVAREGRPGETLAATAAGPQRRPKPKRRLPPEVLTDDEVRALLDACGRYSPVALGNRALIRLMHRAGLRVSEALGLQTMDVDLENGIVRVLHAKDNRHRDEGTAAGTARVRRQLHDAQAAHRCPRDHQGSLSRCRLLACGSREPPSLPTCPDAEGGRSRRRDLRQVRDDRALARAYQFRDRSRADR